jgi:hypothetical protein
MPKTLFRALLIAALAMVISGAAAAQGQGATSPDAFTREANNYRLTMPKVEAMTRVMRAFQALQGEADAAPAREEDESDADENSDTASSGNWLAELDAHAERDPKLKIVFAKAGMSPREYYLALGAWMVADSRFAGSAALEKPTPAQSANRELVKAHPGEFDNLFAEFSAMNKHD